MFFVYCKHILLNIFISLLIYQVNTSTVNNDQRSHKSVTVSLYSKWKQTCLFAETSEFFSDEGNDLFWSFIDLVSTKNILNGQETFSKESYSKLLQITSPLLSTTQLSILKFSLSLRTYSPTVEMFNQIARDKIMQFSLDISKCDVFAEFSTSGLINSHQYACKKDDILSSIVRLLSIDRPFIHPLIYKNDHIHPRSANKNNFITVILYGHIINNEFSQLYNLIKDKMTQTGRIKLVIRHHILTKTEDKVLLSGFGVELAIKSTEYKAQDDTRIVENMHKNLYPTLFERNDEDDYNISKNLENLGPERSYLLERSNEIDNLKSWELTDLSYQAAKKILSSPKIEQLQLLQDISHNFPTVAKSLIKLSINNEIRREVEKNKQIFLHNLNLGTSDTALFIDGMFFDIDSTDIFTLLHYLKQETKIVEGLHQILGNDILRVKKFIKLEVSDEKQDYQVDIRDSAIIYINDLENNRIYKSWPTSLQDLFRPSYPGVLRGIRKNIYHLVMIVDPSKRISFDIIKLAESFYIHKAPLRIGFIFAVNNNFSLTGFDDAGIACLNAFNYINEEKSPYDALSFLTDVIASVDSAGRTESDLQPNDIISLFKSKYKVDEDLIFGSDSSFDTGRKLAWEYLKKTGLGSPVKALLNGVVLKESHLNSELFEEAVLTEIMRQTSMLQKSYYKGELTDSKDILDWLMSRKNVLPRLNKRILSKSEVGVISLLNNASYDHNEKVDDYLKLSKSNLLEKISKEMRYIANSESSCLPVTVLICGDFEQKEPRKLLLSALNYLLSRSKYMRIGIVFNNNDLISHVIEASIKSITSNRLLISFLISFLTKLESSSSLDTILNAQELIPDQYSKTFLKVFSDLQLNNEVFLLHKAFSLVVINNDLKGCTVVCNGKVIRVPLDELFMEDDFSLIEKHSMIIFGEKIMDHLSESEKSNPSLCSDLVMKISNVLISSSITKMRHELYDAGEKHSAILLPPQNSIAPAIDMVAILEPLSRGAQKLSSILIVLRQVFNINLKVFLNCADKHSELPLKNFFRYVISSELKFSDNRSKSKLLFARAHFSSMPLSPLFTLGMITPENWLVEAVSAICDLDNIHLEDVSHSGVFADFELKNLLLEGHCFEQSSGNPPRGLQFILDSKSSPNKADTIVMANLGYFQLKANPGAWSLQLRQGRSSEIYTIVNHENTDPASDGSNVIILISSFRSYVIKVRVNKKPEKQHVDLLYDDNEINIDNSIWESISSWTGTKKLIENNTEDAESDRLNIFSVASGHLYERLLRIMMLSVLKHTQTPLKFWFLKNYLSPTFKDFLPVMAKKYKFDYELVEYKWPRWLHQQTEKQRVIWGYKILFLDVLFPLDLKKIIFVDADQVVRTDLKELRDLDLEGAPYGYTPFCDSREDMEGFRFWKSGYWASHLHGRKYHISALYVVDLARFRKIAAGDRLRGQYQGLSQDPNSLSNLDQDLPNNMIHQVSIKSLPQEWLWCETWCDDESKKKAKTIDLCNNPKTKEPKLVAARRILPEWEGYDNEIKQLMEEWQNIGRNKPLNDDKENLVHKHHKHTEL